MIGRVIEWSARNVVLVLIGTAFLALAGVWAVITTPLDAIPDLSDTQVIVYTEFSGQAPQVVEDQVTYPLTTSLLSVPKSKVVRGFSFFGVSFIYIIFDDGTDPYWARSRVLEYLNAAGRRLPAGVTPTLGPDATGVGWVYQYALTGKGLDLADLRTTQDWQLRYAVAKADGVAEVAGVGGFVNITQTSKEVVFMGTLTAKGLEIATGDGRLGIVREGVVKKVVPKVEHLSFNGAYTAGRGTRVLYLTERAVFELRDGRLTLTEIAPGIDLEREVLAQLAVPVPVASDLKTMDARIFRDVPMGLR